MAVFKIREVLSSFSIKYCILKFEFSKQKLKTGKLQKNKKIKIFCFSSSVHHHEMISYFCKILPLSTNDCFSYYLTYPSLFFIRSNFFYCLIFIFDKNIPLLIKFSIINNLLFSISISIFFKQDLAFSLLT